MWEDERKCEECQWVQLRWKTKKYETEQCEFKKNNELVTDNFNWLEEVKTKN